ncbi:MAG: Cof-type HAD-IIB family hydrolase [Bacteroidales bacterium]|nr:Cof-type HAD-IIB family hydrolase [Bacteroidales bacterium]
MIKAAFFDIDGTLLSFKTHKVSQGTVRAFHKLHNKGIRTFISSGRPQVLIPEMPVTFDGYVTMNGGYCFVGDKVLLKNPIPQQETERWLAYAEERGLCTMIFTEKQMFVNTLDDPMGNAIRDQLDFEMPPLLPIAQMHGQETYQIIAVMDADKDQEVLDMLPHCRLPRWHPHFSDLINRDNSKAAGIESILRHFGLNRDECIGFGDGGNDIEMLEYCGIGVAMGNASDEVKAHADYVTTSVDDEGIEHALSELKIVD